MATDPLAKIEQLALHTMETYRGVEGELTWVTGLAAAADAKKIVAVVAKIRFLDLWQCDECAAYVDLLVDGECPLCYGSTTRIMAISRRTK